MVCSLEMLGAIVVSFLLLRLLMYGFRKLFRIRIGSAHIAIMGLLIWGVTALLRGYGTQDYAPEPLFVRALLFQLAPVMVVIAYELRHHRAALSSQIRS